MYTTKEMIEMLAESATDAMDFNDLINRYIMCGGCGQTDPNKRCLGCLHEFTNKTLDK